MSIVKLGVMQPSYLPWIGQLQQIAFSDVYVYFGGFEFSKNSWINRNRISSNESLSWLTIPVTYSTGDLISQTKVVNTLNWQSKHRKAILNNYKKNDFRLLMEQRYIECQQYQFDSLLENIVFMNQTIFDYTNLSNKIEYITNIEFSQNKNERLIKICQMYGASHYVTGQSGLNYLDIDLFKFHNIKIVVQNYVPEPYPTKYKIFQPYLSCIDFLLQNPTSSLAQRQYCSSGGFCEI